MTPAGALLEERRLGYFKLVEMGESRTPRPEYLYLSVYAVIRFPFSQTCLTLIRNADTSNLREDLQIFHVDTHHKHNHKYDIHAFP